MFIWIVHNRWTNKMCNSHHTHTHTLFLPLSCMRYCGFGVRYDLSQGSHASWKTWKNLIYMRLQKWVVKIFFKALQMVSKKIYWTDLVQIKFFFTSALSLSYKLLISLYKWKCFIWDTYFDITSLLWRSFGPFNLPCAQK